MLKCNVDIMHHFVTVSPPCVFRATQIAPGIPEDPRVPNMPATTGLHHLDSFRCVDLQHGTQVKAIHGQSLMDWLVHACLV